MNPLENPYIRVIISIMENNNVSKILSDWLDSYLNFERLPKKNIFWLDTIEFLCNRFNNPQNAYSSIHIAGSKGKGSVSAFVSSILREAGFSCGLYTSPHIQTLIERITEAGTFFPEKVYDAAFREMVPRIESIIPEQLPNEREITWFELMTLYSFLCFKHAGCNWAVFETGLGGRLDATNILKPKLCILTPIELEHTEFLGNTIPLIAAEKAGIIKKGTPVFVSRQNKDALDVFKNKASHMNAPLFYYDDFVHAVEWELPTLSDGTHDSDCKMHVRIDCGEFFARPLETDLHLVGEVQAENAALAAASVKYLMPALDETVIERGISKAKLPGRFEVTENPLGTKKLVLDGAHTGNSLTGTMDTFNRMFNSSSQIGKPQAGKQNTRKPQTDESNTGDSHGENSHLLFACASDKDIHALTKVILKKPCPFSRICLTIPGEIKKSDLDALSACFKDYMTENKITGISLSVEPDYKKAIKESLEKAGKDNAVLLVTGSFYLVSEVKAVLDSLG